MLQFSTVYVKQPVLKIYWHGSNGGCDLKIKTAIVFGEQLVNPDSSINSRRSRQAKWNL